MHIRYTLTPADHLAWFDYYTLHVVRPWWSRLPVIGRVLLRRRREMFARTICAAANATALGERSIDLSDVGVREHSSTFDFSSPWQDLAFATLSTEHLFFAHASMNAHIIPLRFFVSEDGRDAFVAFTTSHAPSFRDHRKAQPGCRKQLRRST